MPESITVIPVEDCRSLVEKLKSLRDEKRVFIEEPHGHTSPGVLDDTSRAVFFHLVGVVWKGENVFGGDTPSPHAIGRMIGAVEEVLGIFEGKAPTGPVFAIPVYDCRLLLEKFKSLNAEGRMFMERPQRYDMVGTLTDVARSVFLFLNAEIWKGKGTFFITHPSQRTVDEVIRSAEEFLEIFEKKKEVLPEAEKPPGE